jgi:tetratricopeptide (TPR) repeat protein
MDDDRRDSLDEKVRLGHTANALRRSKRLQRGDLAQKLGVRNQRISEIEQGDGVTVELIDEWAKSLDFDTVHAIRTLDLFEYLDYAQRRPPDPIGPTPGQEVAIYEAYRELGRELDAIFRDRIRRENLQRALEAAAGEWERIKGLTAFQQRAEIRRSSGLHTWAFCLFLCEESIRQATDQPREAPRIGRLAVVVARCCNLAWGERLVAYALAHLANTYRVLGRHRKAELLFGKANRRWSLPEAAAADPGVLDPGRIFDLEASLRKDQRKLPLALELLERAYPISKVPGRILVSRSIVLSLMGSYEEALESLRRAAAFLKDGESRDKAVLDYNMGVNYCHLSRFNEAAGLADSAFDLVEASTSRIDVLRCRWLRARVFAGRGDREDALNIYRSLVMEFDQQKLTYDLALVTLELATLLLGMGHSWECRFITRGLPSYFEAKEIYPEALAAIKLFYDSLLQETATESLARQVAAFLYLAQGTPGLRFVPASS